MAAPHKPYPLIKHCLQSDAIDFDKAYDLAWIKGKTVVVTGGASGFGRGFVETWAKHGASVIIGDINVEGGEAVAGAIRKETGNDNVHFVYCNVVEWQSQVDFFKEAIRLSPTGGIDTVVANAGVAGIDGFEGPQGLDVDAPPKPNMTTLNVNLIGVLYTAHLALFWLQRNPGSKSCDPRVDPASNARDRHLLLLGSMASLSPVPGQALYTTAKHAVVGLFRSLRTTAWVHGVRVNVLCPYFIDTPILPAGARALLAGGATGKPEDVVDAASRFAADSSIIGRSMYIGPKMNIVMHEDGNWELATKEPSSKLRAVWEPFAHDLDDSELFTRRFVVLLSVFARLRGVTGFFWDMLRAVWYGLKAGPSAFFGSRAKKGAAPKRAP